MNKRLMFIIIAVFLIIISVFIILNIIATKQGAVSAPSDLVAQAKGLQMNGRFLEAKTIYKKLISEFPGSGQVSDWQKKIEELNIKLLFSPAITPGSLFYEIKPGDSLTKIARQFKTTTDLIKKSNNLADDKILPGRKIKVWNQPFSMVVDKSQNTLILKTNEDVIKTYIVSTGINNSTPTGNFKIVNKLLNPTWFKAGVVIQPGSPQNILGSRWLGFDLAGYGIHGTTEPQSLGKQVTQGCVRMSNSDVEELYAIIPEGTEVTVVD